MNKDWAELNPTKIQAHAAAGNFNFDKTLGAVISHEVFKHIIGGTVGDFGGPKGFIDSWPMIVGGILSPKGCKELADELDIN